MGIGLNLAGSTLEKDEGDRKPDGKALDGFVSAAMLEKLRKVIEAHEAKDKDAVGQDRTNAAIPFPHRGRKTVGAKSALLKTIGFESVCSIDSYSLVRNEK